MTIGLMNDHNVLFGLDFLGKTKMVLIPLLYIVATLEKDFLCMALVVIGKKLDIVVLYSMKLRMRTKA